MSSRTTRSASTLLASATRAKTSSTTTTSQPPSLSPPQPSTPPSQSPPFLASSPDTPETIIATLTTLTAQASSHLQTSTQPNDFYESALALMQVLDLILALTEKLRPNEYDVQLRTGDHQGRKLVIVLAEEMLSLNIRLCIAFMELGMWELVGARVGDAMELVEMGKGKGGYFVEKEAREWLVEMEEVAREQVVIDNGCGEAMGV